MIGLLLAMQLGFLLGVLCTEVRGRFGNNLSFLLLLPWSLVFMLLGLVEVVDVGEES